MLHVNEQLTNLINKFRYYYDIEITTISDILPRYSYNKKN